MPPLSPIIRGDIAKHVCSRKKHWTYALGLMNSNLICWMWSTHLVYGFINTTIQYRSGASLHRHMSIRQPGQSCVLQSVAYLQTFVYNGFLGAQCVPNGPTKSPILESKSRNVQYSVTNARQKWAWSMVALT